MIPDRSPLARVQDFFAPRAHGWEERFTHDSVQFSRALTEFARIIRPGGRLAIFHALGRVALARRHGGVPADDDAIAPERLTRMLVTTGWTVDLIDDAEERFLVLAHF